MSVLMSMASFAARTLMPLMTTLVSSMKSILARIELLVREVWLVGCCWCDIWSISCSLRADSSALTTIASSDLTLRDVSKAWLRSSAWLRSVMAWERLRGGDSFMLATEVVRVDPEAAAAAIADSLLMGSLDDGTTSCCWLLKVFGTMAVDETSALAALILLLVLFVVSAWMCSETKWFKKIEI